MNKMVGVWVLRLVVVLTVVTFSHGFVLRRRDWEDDDNTDLGLAEAIPVLREEQRRLEEQEEEEPGFWSEPQVREEEEEALDLQPRLGENGDLLDSLIEDEVRNDIGEYFMPGMSYEREGEQEDSVNDITESPADLKELESILEASDDEQVEEDDEEEFKSKRNIPVALGGQGPDRSKRADKDLNALIEQTAEELGNQVLLGEDDNHTPVPVSNEELKAVLEDDGNEEEGEEKLTQEEILPPLNNYQPMVPLKRKRSSRMPEVTDESEVDDGSSAREYIRRFLELEDDENTNLANALNLATMAQVHRDDKLVVPEAKFIRKAIEDEQAIQELRSELSGPKPSPMIAAAEAIAKRELEYEREPEPEDEQEYKKGQEEYYPGQDELDDEENMIQEVEQINPATDLAEKLREYLDYTGAIQQENDVEEGSPLQRGAWLDRPIEIGQEGLTEDEWELNPLVRELYQRYSDGELSKRGNPEEEILGPEVEEIDPDEIEEDEEAIEEQLSPEEIEEMEEEIENTLEGYLKTRQVKNELQREEELEEVEEEEKEEEEEEGLCPAIELVDGCQYAVGNLGLKLDAEAMDLCNRHQLCYTCGGVHGMSATDCDNGFLREANRLCEAEGNEEDCSTDAAGLFILMLQSHKFYANPREAPSACQNPCAMDFVVGLDK